MILFSTTNKDKIAEARAILGVEIKATALEIEEIQSLDPIKVAVRKAADYFEILKKPLIVEDVSLTFKALGSLPGTYISDFLKTLGNEGLVKLLEGQMERGASAQTTIVYYFRKNGYKIFEAKVEGRISLNLKGGKGFGWDPIFIPAGSNKTFAEMNLKEKNGYSMRATALKMLKEYLESKPYN